MENTKNKNEDLFISINLDTKDPNRKCPPEKKQYDWITDSINSVNRNVFSLDDWDDKIQEIPVETEKPEIKQHHVWRTDSLNGDSDGVLFAVILIVGIAVIFYFFWKSILVIGLLLFIPLFLFKTILASIIGAIRGKSIGGLPWQIR